MIEISKSEAKHLALSSQLLLNEHQVKSQKDLLKIIDQLGYIQIDTISIVERAHKHVLWTRFPGYKNALLDELIDKDRKVFEFWDHAASYIPMEHFRFSLPRKKRYKARYKDWAAENRKLLKHILDRIRAEGALMSREFKDETKRGPWWDWKPAKDALEYLFHSGDLMVWSRRSFQKVYDLTERVLPANTDTSYPTDAEISEHLILKAIKANGPASQKEMTYLRHHNDKTTRKVLQKLIDDKKIIPVQVNGADEQYYTTKSKLRELNGAKKNKHIHILSPFDNMVIQRKRMTTLFDFDYVIECYVPAPKRKYGYFCLPVIYGDKFIGRLDAKADRQSGVLRVINFFPEKGVKMTGKMKTLFVKKLMELAKFSGCDEVKHK
jgi:uncharacterized protein YcaQ